jgi:hypothetical protein
VTDPGRPRGLTALARSLLWRARGARRSRQESGFQTRLQVDRAAPELLLSPHLDDAALDCWSLLMSDRDLNVVNLFAGVPPPGQQGVWEAVIGVADAAARARLRIAEDARALALAGREPLNLPLLDAQYRKARPTLEQLDRAVSDAVASASRVYVPAGIGAHGDHLLVRRYGRMLLAAGMPVTLYAELPYCIFHGWPAWVDASEPDPSRDVDAYWRSFLRRVPELADLRAAQVTRLQPDAAAAKLEAIRCYRASLNFGVRQLLAAPQIHGYEVRWDLPAGV